MRARIVHWFRNQRIQTKIIAIYLPLVFIPLLTLGIFSYQINTASSINKTKKNVQDESRLITTRIDTILSNAESFANVSMLELNKEEKLKLKQKGDQLNSDPVDYELLRAIENRLDFAKMIFPEVESALFIDRAENVYSTNSNMQYGTEKGLRSEMYRDVNKSNGKPIWFPMEKRDYWVTQTEEPILTIGKKILDTETLEPLGILLVNIKEETLSSVYRSIGPLQPNGYYIIDEKGTIISSQNKSEMLQPMEEISKVDVMSQESMMGEIPGSDGHNILLSSVGFSKMNWKLINEISVRELTRDSRQVSQVILLIGGICLILAILGAIMLSRSIGNPIMQLSKQMKRIREENIDQPIDVRTNDEIGILGSGLNVMLGRINDLLVKVKDEQRKKREYELALIQNQIKPHFFYNTLDLIYVLCKSGESETAGKATKSLADFYRVALSNGQEIITIREEIRNVNSYLSIQRTRYSDLFDFQIKIQDDMMDYAIPKLTLQPLVENSIYHGLKEKGSFGHIQIEGVKKDDVLELIVKDDGIGFSPNMLKQMDQKRSEERGSFGLSSVDERIKLYYGERYGTRIHSEPGEGSEVIVVIPLTTRGDLQDV